MSLRRNILANYASQLYVTAAGIVMVPLYIKYMGAEAYGLVGFFALLQAMFNLLDMGLTPTVARESARYRGGAISLMDYRQLVRALEGVFAGVALVGGALLFAMAGSIAGQWLNVSQMPVQEVTIALQLMAVIVALRWMCGLYRGVITGSERLVWLSGFNSLIATGRFVLILPMLIFVSASPVAFFGFQLGVALFEILGLAWMAYRLLPPIPHGERIRWCWAPLKPVLKFSLSVAFTSSVWVLVTQGDKLVLSKILPLADYGYFTMAVLAASGVSIVSGPLSSALLPRLALLQSQGDEVGLIKLYRLATQAMAVIALPVAAVLGFGAEHLLLAWTGDTSLAAQAGPILRLYALGNGVLAMSAFAYYLQYAKGDVRLHLIGNLLFVMFLIPSIISAATHFGGVGAGWAWLCGNLLYLLLWVPLVHRRLSPGLHGRWLLVDLLPVAGACVLMAWLMVLLLPWSTDRLTLLAELMGVGGAVLVAAVLACSGVRRRMVCKFKLSVSN